MHPGRTDLPWPASCRQATVSRRRSTANSRRLVRRARSKQVMPAKNASGRCADGHTDEGALQARIVTVTSVAFDRGAQISTGEEPACSSHDGPEHLSPRTSFRPRASLVLRAQHSSRVAAGRKLCGRQPGWALLARPGALGHREEEGASWPWGVMNARHILCVRRSRRESGPQHKRNNGWVLKTIHPASTCIDRADLGEFKGKAEHPGAPDALSARARTIPPDSDPDPRSGFACRQDRSPCRF